MKAQSKIRSVLPLDSCSQKFKESFNAYTIISLSGSNMLNFRNSKSSNSNTGIISKFCTKWSLFTKDVDYRPVFSPLTMACDLCLVLLPH